MAERQLSEAAQQTIDTIQRNLKRISEGRSLDAIAASKKVGTTRGKGCRDFTRYTRFPALDLNLHRLDELAELLDVTPWSLMVDGDAALPEGDPPFDSTWTFRNFFLGVYKSGQAGGIVGKRNKWSALVVQIRKHPTWSNRVSLVADFASLNGLAPWQAICP